MFENNLEIEEPSAKAATKKRTKAQQAREKLREKGQFWTPAWVAEAMVQYLLPTAYATDRLLFDPAVGGGAFYDALRVLDPAAEVRLRATDIDPNVIGWAQEAVNAEVDLRDYMSPKAPAGPFSTIIANPPYVRHHRLGLELKAELRTWLAGLPGQLQMDGRAGLHIYFLVKALTQLRPGGRLAFIVPADTCEGRFAEPLWQWISTQYCVDKVVTFRPEATPFPGVDTNAILLCLKHEPPQPTFTWLQVETAGPALLTHFSQPQAELPAGIQGGIRQLIEGLETGFSRPPQAPVAANAPAGCLLEDIAQVMRGIATGENEFFFLTSKQVAELDVPQELLRRAVGRVRDADGPELTEARLAELDAKGRPTYLLSIDNRPLNELPAHMQDYLATGVAKGLPERPLIKQRRPWYKMERRQVPPFLFAYLGRRGSPFIRNTAGALPLTGFLCVYPAVSPDPEYADKLLRVLSHPDTVANLHLVGKSYGGGAIKVEPGGLRKLPIPAHVLAEVGLRVPNRQPAPPATLFD